MSIDSSIHYLSRCSILFPPVSWKRSIHGFATLHVKLTQYLPCILSFRHKNFTISLLYFQSKEIMKEIGRASCRERVSSPV